MAKESSLVGYLGPLHRVTTPAAGQVLVALPLDRLLIDTLLEPEVGIVEDEDFTLHSSTRFLISTLPLRSTRYLSSSSQ